MEALADLMVVDTSLEIAVASLRRMDLINSVREEAEDEEAAIEY